MLKSISAFFNRALRATGERRRAPRRKAHHHARLMFNVSVMGDEGGRTVPVQGHTLDVSEIGLGLVVDTLRVGDNLLTDPDCTLRIVLLDLPTGRVSIQASAVRYEPLGGEIERHLIGVEIKHMDESDRYRFISYLNTIR